MNLESSSGLNSLQGLIIDMDGVLWHGDTPMPGLNLFFQVIRERGIRIVLATNNNTLTPEGFRQKAGQLGVEIAPHEVVTASLATLSYLESCYPKGARIYVIGEAPLKSMISEAGYTLADENVAAVVAALDRSLTYEMLKRATLLIRAGAAFIGPNPDACYPTSEGIVPGSGAVLAALATSTGCQPTIIGKPEKWIFQLALERLGLPVDRVASLGDRLDTDILGGQLAGMKGILVLTGVTSAADVASSQIQPAWIFPGIEALAHALQSEGSSQTP